MKNKQKTLSRSTSLAVRVALRRHISKLWENRRRDQRIRNVSSVAFWTKEINKNISALKEIRTF